MIDDTNTPEKGDPLVMYESQAILLYLEQQYKTVSLVPSDPREAAIVYMRQAESDSFGMLIDPLEYLFEKKACYLQHIPEVIKARKAIEHEMENLWNVYLEKTTFLGGEKMSIADCAFFPLLRYLVRHGFPIGNYRFVKRYYKLIEERESAKHANPIGWTRETKGKNLFRDLS
eukprot:CAMPEP_0168534160 /NCGR_PEP_ID=MMETSP0405-20121227/17670_1 /TAXON_ID=498012 /ORGANISM="Trichosphaerium sp, Strain Am-I-7 wt" /LENGTH=172 /DNA_ID=CAMNT_0008560685 /DNA_START=198 /DNA_END=712 /DNA_ORIENTATION=-